MAQSRLVARALEEAHPGLEVELAPSKTRGDRTAGVLAEIGGKGLFTHELEEGLRSGEIDLAVHSLKDLPARLPEGLEIAAFPRRADPRDVLVSSAAQTIEELPAGGRILTGSLRRKAQLLRWRPDLRIEGIRGNVGTRLRKWRRSGAEATLLAAAGLARLDLADGDDPAHPLDPEIMIPAPGQGTLALETAVGSRAARLCRALNDATTSRGAAAERAVVVAFGADCTLPLAAWARPGAEGASFVLSVFLASRDARRWATVTVSDQDPTAAAQAAVTALEREGARSLLEPEG